VSEIAKHASLLTRAKHYN